MWAHSVVMNDVNNLNREIVWAMQGKGRGDCNSWKLPFLGGGGGRTTEYATKNDSQGKYAPFADMKHQLIVVRKHLLGFLRSSDTMQLDQSLGDIVLFLGVPLRCTYLHCPLTTHLGCYRDAYKFALYQSKETFFKHCSCDLVKDTSANEEKSLYKIILLITDRNESRKIFRNETLAPPKRTSTSKRPSELFHWSNHDLVAMCHDLCCSLAFALQIHGTLVAFERNQASSSLQYSARCASSSIPLVGRRNHQSHLQFCC
eukprot:284814775_6